MQVVTQRRLFARAGCFGGKEAGGAIAAQIRDEHTIAVGRQRRRHLVIGAHVVGKAVQQDHGGAVGWPVLLVGDVEDVGSDGFSLHLLNV